MNQLINKINIYFNKKNHLIIISSIVIIGILSYFTFSNNIKEHSFSSMGTLVNIKIAENNIDPTVFNEIENAFFIIENTFSGKLDLNVPAVRDVLSYNMKVFKETNGQFSPFLGSVIKLWKFDDYTKKITKIPSKQSIEKALKKAEVNLYASAKGLAIDQASHILKKYEIKNFVINAGGDILAKGNNFGKTWKIGIQGTKNYITCKQSQFAIATSSNLYNYYIINGKKYGHLINGRTGFPVMAEKSVSVIAKNATTADTYSTAFFIDDSLKNKKKDLGFIKNENNKIKIYNLPKTCSIN